MRGVFILVVHLLTTGATLRGPGGAKAVGADRLLMTQQRLGMNRSRSRAPNLSALDRSLLGFWSLFLPTRRIPRAAIMIRPSTLLRVHEALKKRKDRLRFFVAAQHHEQVGDHLRRALLVEPHPAAAGVPS